MNERQRLTFQPAPVRYIDDKDTKPMNIETSDGSSSLPNPIDCNKSKTNNVETSGRIASDPLETQKAPRESNQNREQDTEEGDSEHSNSENGTYFRCNVHDTLEKALSLASHGQQKEVPSTHDVTQTSTPQISEEATEGKEKAGKIDIPIEALRDLINKHSREFWYPTSTATDDASTRGNTQNDVVFFEETKTDLSQKKSIENDSPSEKPAKRIKVDSNDRDKNKTDQEAAKEESKEIPSLEDRETLAAVRALLETSMNQLSSTGKGDDMSSLLEQLEMLPLKESTTEGNGKKDIQELARQVTLSFAQDLSEILRAVTNVGSSISLKTGKGIIEGDKSDLQLSKPSSRTLSAPTVDASLLCDEKDLAQLREEDQSMEEDDDEIIEISQDENFVQQNLICNETEDSLFGKTRNHKGESISSDEKEDEALLIAQKIALLRETKRLIREKTLVLTKRRLGIKDPEDLSIVI